MLIEYKSRLYVIVWQLTCACLVCYITNTIEVEGRIEDMVASAEVDLQVGAVVVVDGHAHLQHLGLVFLQVWLDKDGFVARDDDHALSTVLGVFVPGGVCLS